MNRSKIFGVINMVLIGVEQVLTLSQQKQTAAQFRKIRPMFNGLLPPLYETIVESTKDGYFSLDEAKKATNAAWDALYAAGGDRAINKEFFARRTKEAAGG